MSLIISKHKSLSYFLPNHYYNIEEKSHLQSEFHQDQELASDLFIIILPKDHSSHLKYE